MQPPLFQDQDPAKLPARMHAVFETFEAGIWMLRERIDREHPGIEAQERTRLLREEMERPLDTGDPFLRPTSWKPASTPVRDAPSRC
ncbi:hypothetical protein [Phycisphaera mikurensis]|uniref:hypothetical protein n=1 Tax=Phycisphaera mikurensis TaxID=547188 RepID=UPI00059E677F|nr:hypothetical protein [Phycisphaera mikurensis]MBB6442326.1 hypothetical protein [Phycisphaera mikurensis]